MRWERGHGRLGMFAPLLGGWVAEAALPGDQAGTLICRRCFQPVLGGGHIALRVAWQSGAQGFEELTLIGMDSTGAVSFWSFGSDGRQGQGRIRESPDVHPQALAFLSETPGARERNLYWPDGSEGFYWAVERETDQGWSRYTEHHYFPDPDAEAEAVAAEGIESLPPRPDAPVSYSPDGPGNVSNAPSAAAADPSGTQRLMAETQGRVAEAQAQIDRAVAEISEELARFGLFQPPQ